MSIEDWGIQGTEFVLGILLKLLLVFIGFGNSAFSSEKYLLQSMKSHPDYLLFDFANPQDKYLKHINIVFISPDCIECDRDYLRMLSLPEFKSSSHKFIAVASHVKGPHGMEQLEKKFSRASRSYFYVDPGSRLAKKFNFNSESDKSFLVVIKNNKPVVQSGINLKQPNNLLRFKKEWE